MTPLALRARAELKPTWRRAWKDIVGVALLCPLSNILVLTAMVFTPVSYVALAREISILIGALTGAHLLREGVRRTIAASAMVGGSCASRSAERRHGSWSSRTAGAGSSGPTSLWSSLLSQRIA